MGLSASATRLLQYTNRKHDITNTLMHCSTQKSSLARDMKRVSQDYQNALNSKIYKWSDNNGVTYSNLSYSNLMRPSSMNKNQPYMITDLSGRVVIDNKYKKYAEMIADKGGYDNCRFEILSELTGVDIKVLESIHQYHEKIFDAKTALDSFRLKPDPSDSKEYPGLTNDGIESLLKKAFGSSSGVGTTNRPYKFPDGSFWADAYNKNGTIDLLAGRKSDQNATDYALHGVRDVAYTLKNTLSEFLDEADKQAWESAFTKLFGDSLGNGGDIATYLANGSGYIKKDGEKYSLKAKDFIDLILSTYENEGGNFKSKGGYGGDNTAIIWYDKSSTSWAKYQTDLEKWNEDHKAAQQELNKLNSECGELLTSDIERMIDFYDQLFSTIAEKGWIQNSFITNDEYLNEMLQNNMFTITEVHRQHICDDGAKKHYYKNTYITDIADNMTNIYKVNDEDTILEAQIEYENEKAIINEKESKIDLRMENLKLELEAINTMSKSIETGKKENIERTMNITG